MPTVTRVVKWMPEDGGNTSLECITPFSASPGATYTWYHAGRELTGKTSRTLVRDPLDFTHGGSYTCSVTDHDHKLQTSSGFDLEGNTNY